MKVLLVSTYDIRGGAAIAAYRLRQGLQSIGCESKLMVQTKLGKDAFVYAPNTNLAACIANSRVTFDHWPLKKYPRSKKTPFSPQWLPDFFLNKVPEYNPDIINLHWINSGFIRIETIGKINQPVVWTLHDMWTFTGGCHYSNGCKNYEGFCGYCPQLESKQDKDLSRSILMRKLKSWKRCNFKIVTPSNWLKECAQSSTLFKDVKIDVIPQGLNLQSFKPFGKKISRELLGLPKNKKIVLFGAVDATSDPRKGFQLLKKALKALGLTDWKERLELFVFGSNQSHDLKDIGIKTHSLGHLHDELSLAIVYSAADVMVVPSIEEAFGQTVTESLACGTPVVAFNATGPMDLISHQVSGYLAHPFDTEDLASGIAWILEDDARHEKLSFNARKAAISEFSIELQAHRYNKIFNEIIIS